MFFLFGCVRLWYEECTPVIQSTNSVESFLKTVIDSNSNTQRKTLTTNAAEAFFKTLKQKEPLVIRFGEKDTSDCD